MFDVIYQKNINALKNVDIVLATKIIQSSRGDSFELSIVSEKHQLYNIIDLLQEKPLYNNVIDELQEHLQELHPKNREPFIYLFGIANAYTLPILLANEKHKRVVIIEPELELLFVSLHLYDLSAAIANGRLKIFHQKSFNFAQAVHLFREDNARHFARTFNLITTAAYYSEHFQDEIQQTQSLFLDALSYDISHLVKDFNGSLQALDRHLGNLPEIFNHNSLQSLLQANKAGGWSLIISDLPNKSQIKILKELAGHITIIATQEIVLDLYKENINADIVTAIHYEEEIWQKLPQKIQEQMILLLPSHEKDLQLLHCHATTIISTLDAYYNRYFDLKSFGYIKEHLTSSHMAYELSFLLKFSDTIIIDKTLKDERSQEFKHYCYLCALYKEQMNTYHLLKTKPKHLLAKQESLSKLNTSIMKQNLSKKILQLHPDKEELVRSTKARQDIKISLLIKDGYALIQNLQTNLADIRPWYEKLEGLTEKELVDYYDENQLSALMDKLVIIKSGIEKSLIYQRFFHDFLYPSMLLLFIEEADINSRSVSCNDDIKEKAMHWSISSYQWLTQLQRNMPQTIEMLLKHNQL